jgi:VanZ family protein
VITDNAMPTGRPAAVVNTAYAATLVVLAVLPRAIVEPGLGLSDGTAHALAYGLQGALLVWALRPGLGPVGVVLAVLGSLGLGLLTEAVQALLPYRSFELADLAADGLGALVGACAALAVGVGRPAGPGSW